MRVGMYLLMVLLINYSISHNCNIHNRPNPDPVFIEHYDENDFRFLQDTTWTPIRIYIDYTQLDKDKSSGIITQAYYDQLKNVLTQTIKIYQALLNVKSSTTKLKLPKLSCVDNMDPNIINVGVDADLVVIPNVDKTLDSSVEAAASYCAQDSKTFRPLAGQISFNTNLNFNKTNFERYYVLLVLHELNHVLSFHSQLFPYYIDSTGKRIPIANTTTTATINGISRTLIKSPKVLAAAKKHFNCDSMVGLELENQGGEGTAGSHWDARTMIADYMIGQSYGEVFISDMTLALFEDSGWYTANYYTGGLFRYGKNQGCGFLQTKCIKDGATQFPNEFSIKENPATMCLSGRTGRGFSSMSVGKTPVDSVYDYWNNPNKAGFSAADYCPVAWPSEVDGYFFGFSCTVGKPANTVYGEVIGNDSSCFVSTITKKGSKLNVEKATCFKVTCDYSKKVYSVGIAIDSGYTAMCPTEGGKVSVSGLDGEFLCPDFNLICTQSTLCIDAIDCVNKKVLSVPSTYNYTPVGNYQSLTYLTTSTNASTTSGINNSTTGTSSGTTSTGTSSGTSSTGTSTTSNTGTSTGTSSTGTSTTGTSSTGTSTTGTNSNTSTTTPTPSINNSGYLIKGNVVMSIIMVIIMFIY
jgi:hypothetical protein